MIPAWLLIPAIVAGACLGVFLMCLCAASRNGQGGDE